MICVPSAQDGFRHTCVLQTAPHLKVIVAAADVVSAHTVVVAGIMQESQDDPSMSYHTFLAALFHS